MNNPAMHKHIRSRQLIEQADSVRSMISKMGSRYIMDVGSTPRLPNGVMDLARLDALRDAHIREHEAAKELLLELTKEMDLLLA